MDKNQGGFSRQDLLRGAIIVLTGLAGYVYFLYFPPIELGGLQIENLFVAFFILAGYLLLAFFAISITAFLKRGYSNLKTLKEGGLILGLSIGLISALINSLISGIIYQTLSGNVTGLVVGLILGLIYGSILGLIYGLITGLVTEKISWSNKK